MVVNPQSVGGKGQADTVLIVEDDIEFASTLRQYLGEAGFKAKAVDTPGRAINILEYNPQYVGAIIADLRFGDRFLGMQVLEARNRIDDRIPFYVVTGAANWGIVNTLRLHGIDDIFEKKGDSFVDGLVGRLRLAYCQYLDLGCPTSILKLGGSPYDEINELFNNHLVPWADPKAYPNVIRILSQLQQELDRQLIITVGGGYTNEQAKGMLKYEWMSDEDYAEAQYTAMEFNLKCMQAAFSNLGNEAIHLKPEHFSGREFLRDSTGKEVSPRSPEEMAAFIRDHNKIVLMVYAPPHLYRDFNVKRSDSDSQFALASIPFKSKDMNLTIIKRLCGICSFDPFTGLDFDRKHWTRAIKAWRGVQHKYNRVYQDIPIKYFLNNQISRVGAYDNAGEHMMENSALYLLNRFGIPVNVCPFDLPSFYPGHDTNPGDYKNGHHIITNEPWPRNSEGDPKDSEELQYEMLKACVTGERHEFVSRIVPDKTAEEGADKLLEEMMPEVDWEYIVRDVGRTK